MAPLTRTDVGMLLRLALSRPIARPHLAGADERSQDPVLRAAFILDWWRREGAPSALQGACTWCGLCTATWCDGCEAAGAAQWHPVCQDCDEMHELCRPCKSSGVNIADVHQRIYGGVRPTAVPFGATMQAYGFLTEDGHYVAADGADDSPDEDM